MERQSRKLTPQKEGAKFLLSVLSVVAEKNATALCRGLLYEPEIPKKIKDKLHMVMD